MRFFAPIAPTILTLNARAPEMTLGVIYSEMDELLPIDKVARGMLQTSMEFLVHFPFVNTTELDAFSDYKRFLLEFGAADIIMSQNQVLMDKALTGGKIKCSNQLEVINTYHTLESLCTIMSLDASKITGDTIFYRHGYFTEQYAQDKEIRLHNTPLLSDHIGPICTESACFPRVRLRKDSKQILTFMFSFVKNAEELSEFEYKLIRLKQDQEEHAKTRTQHVAIYSGFPCAIKTRYTKQYNPMIFVNDAEIVDISTGQERLNYG